LERLLKVKERQKEEEEAMHIEDRQQGIVTENQMLKVVLYLVSRKKQMAT
jgi:hypothetical protein